MSYVTDVMLILSLAEDLSPIDNRGAQWEPDVPAVSVVNNLLVEEGHAPLRMISCFAGGTKGFQAIVFAGSFNHFDGERLRLQLTQQKWRLRESVQLLVKEEFDHRFALYLLSD